MEKKWLIKSRPEDTKIQELRSMLKVDKIVSTLLLQRQIDNFDTAEDFFRPKLENLHDPFLMHDMDRAVVRLNQAIDNKESVLLFGDYDVDGTTSVSLLYLYLKKYINNLHYYIPDRYKEGYGISENGILFAKEQDCKLIISLDCGIRSVDKVELAKNLNIDFIVCDHHTPGEILPDCILLDPKKKNCNYPYKDLSGCGVGFKLLQALSIQNSYPQEDLFQYLDFLTISIGADLVGVDGENRIFAHHGIQVMNTNIRPVFKTILELAVRPMPITLTDVVFTIAPRINAAGRIRSGMFAVEMMVSDDPELIKKIAAEIEEDNKKRRELDSEITLEALEILDNTENFNSRKTTIVSKDNWHKGVIGIVASRLIEKHFKPTLVFSKIDGKYVGSARTVNDFDIHNAISQCEEFVDQFGGHVHAAGLTISEEKFENFCTKLEKVVQDSICEEDLIPQQKMDYCLDFIEIFQITENRTKIPKLKRILDQFEPHGPKNMKPLFLSENVYCTNSKLLKDVHLKMSLVQPDNDLQIEAIGFNLGSKMEMVAPGLPFDIIYTIETNTWMDRTTLQLNIKDIRPTI